MKSSSAARQTIPDDLTAVLAGKPKAARAFAALPPSHQRQYVKWIEEAKKPQTRQRRLAKAAQMVLGKK
jgi:uncharacterized protein YdeI (YjbR/CyaY-like superfamily)